ncbi:phosphatase PAP2 family protein [Cytophagales bacterium LB-30]|uniref:Phosphatase PAP2 family protein n=1 Tax=Shiella aurantiaca TaxID=3058365 RepID=A0ABT8F0T2_9BACT|nr:phosphatase PAP2 family protein [Shiella aurantiaca]MDN4164056.1 phosphatase PAP2 family protein [Shiella aurantiaca]
MNKNLFYIYLFCFLILGILASFPKGDLELLINQLYIDGLGQFFKYWTHLGDGLVYVAIMLFFLAYHYYRAILTATVIIVQTIFVQIMKRWIFDAPRPKAFFADMPNVELNFVEGVKVHTAHSFPSGHTASAFAIATLFSVLIGKHKWSMLLAIMALLVAFSRVYIMQHFFQDVFVGAVIGFLSVFLSQWILRKAAPGWEANAKLQRGLLSK